MNPSLLVAIGAFVIGPLVGFLAATRKLSGKIATSDASQLWTAAEAMRKEYRDDLLLSNQRVVALETRVANLETLNHDLSVQNAVLQKRIDVLFRENGTLRVRIALLQDELGEERLKNGT